MINPTLPQNRIALTRSQDNIHFSSPFFDVKGRTPAPVITGLPLSTPAFAPVGGEFPATVAGCPGKILCEAFAEQGVRILRESFLTDNGRMAALRITVENEGETPIHLDTLTPLAVQDPSDFTVGEAGAADWRILKLGRFKSDIPAVFRPASRNIDYQDAAFNAQNVTAGMGVQGDVSEHYNFNLIVSEPITVIHSEDSPDTEGLAVAVLGQAEHLTSISYQFEADPNQLRSFDVICEFDERRIDPGSAVSTHWIVVFPVDQEQNALNQFVEFQWAELKIPEPQPPRSLYCSWYFYGREFLPSDLEENLQELKNRPMPLDTFIIDNGWMDSFGDWNANAKWPAGMARAADMIREAGLEPGIWTTPFVMMKHSRMAREHPELIARDKHGEPVTFGYVEGDCYVVDVTHPNCKPYFEEVFGRLRSWGYTYHKLDFVRAIAVNPDIRFYDRRVNRPMAYRMGLEMIRKAIGEGGYILACGGLYDAANYGVADSIRTGSDSIGSWEHPSGDRAAGTLVQVKQGLFRAYVSKLICTDPDCLMLRRRTEPFRIHQAEKHNWLSDGKFSDEEAFSLVVRQYLSGGSTNITERFAELPEDRRRLLSHIIPAFAPPAEILDFDSTDCPTLACTRVTPRCPSMDPWLTLSVSNWGEADVTRDITLDLSGMNPEGRFAVTEFRSGAFLGLFAFGDSLSLEVPVHGTRVLRIAEWKDRPLVIGTDLHITGGGCELTALQATEASLSGRLQTAWEYPVEVSVLFPGISGPVVSKETVEPNTAFHISCNEVVS